MSLGRFMIHPVTLVEPTLVVDRYGATVPDWGVPPAATYDEAGWFTRTGTDEMAQGREAITDDYELSLPATSAITGAMRVQHAGATYEIRGSIDRAETPEGTHHLVAHLRQVQG